MEGHLMFKGDMNRVSKPLRDGGWWCGGTLWLFQGRCEKFWGRQRYIPGYSGYVKMLPFGRIFA